MWQKHILFLFFVLLEVFHIKIFIIDYVSGVLLDCSGGSNCRRLCAANAAKYWNKCFVVWLQSEGEEGQDRIYRPANRQDHKQ